MYGRITEFIKIVYQIFITIFIRVSMCTNHFQLFFSIKSISSRRRILYCTIIQFGIFIRIQKFRQTSCLLQIKLPSVIHRYFLITGSTFCLNQNNSIGSTGSINSSGSTILQYRNTLNIIRIQIRKTHFAFRRICSETRNTVNNQQRCTIYSTDVYIRFFCSTWIATGSHYLQTGYLSAQSLININSRHLQ